MSAFCDRPGEGVFFYMPNEGRFILSPMPIAGAIPATVKFNRVTFESNGQKYVVVNGMPVSRAEKLWVLHDPAYKPQRDPDQGPSIGAGPLAKVLR